MQPPSQLSSDSHSDHHFDQVCRNERKDTCRQRLRKSVRALIGQPHGSEEITDRRAKNHTCKAQKKLISPFVYKKSADGRHEEIADDVASRGSEELSGTAGEACEHGEACQTQQNIDDYAQGSQLHSQDGYRKIDCQKAQGNRHRADRDL